MCIRDRYCSISDKMKSIDLVSGTLAKIKHLENELIALKNEYLAKQDQMCIRDSIIIVQIFPKIIVRDTFFI